MTIVLDSEFTLGDVVESKLNDVCGQDEERMQYIIYNITITGIDPNGLVTTYSMDCSDRFGNNKSFKSFELQKVEVLK